MLTIQKSTVYFSIAIANFILLSILNIVVFHEYSYATLFTPPGTILFLLAMVSNHLELFILFAPLSIIMFFLAIVLNHLEVSFRNAGGKLRIPDRNTVLRRTLLGLIPLVFPLIFLFDGLKTLKEDLAVLKLLKQQQARSERLEWMRKEQAHLYKVINLPSTKQ